MLCEASFETVTWLVESRERRLLILPRRVAPVAEFLDVEVIHLIVPRHRAARGMFADVTDAAAETGL
jgi:hypothetical protein